ncbi:M14 family metallopeptidase [Mucilaginibacter aquatilis]|uniref:Zinc carboxypeptidase n=1 Tax=Mucilaginibacter aquatilis TaxID=1517760 RepID=A0A6I4IGA8_9SPHI|nr:M14 family metallopeptidase [Mucilaginibacter aquatilis]MVN92576.1 zinc carboxypeptidase [Mucilaginibacter aquatilis]
MKFIYLLILFLSTACCSLAQDLESPSQFLGYPLGSRYTLHYRVAEYFRYAAGKSKHIKLLPYGTTNEGRPLMIAVVGSEENMARLENIRQHNLFIAGLSKSQASLANAPAIVWLSYNVHGNEPSSSEAAMQTLFDLANTANNRTQAWLQNTVVIIDPCLNPDGRDRYVNFYNQASGLTANPDPSSREHIEPWPGGRVNHYYFDLNRDWAWQTQKEVQARVALYNKWLPQVHVDFHEQGYNNPYYFAPAAEPFHKDITAWQREFQTIIGKNNARYFDKNGWLYFTKEVFDLLYPSYGDTYPLYNGSIGMTYEQGGGPAGGLAVTMRSGDTLTLADRIAHHTSTGLSTVETVSQHALRVLDEYKKYFDNGRNNPPGRYKTYVIKNDNPDKLAKLAELFDKNLIQYGYGVNRNAKGFNYFNGKIEGFAIKQNYMVVNAYQPKATLLNVLLEPKTFIADSNTYDITAWSLPYAYGLQSYGVTESIKPVNAKATAKSSPAPKTTSAYAYVATWQSIEDVKFLTALLKRGVKVRYASQAFEVAGKKFKAGSLIITRAGNARNFDKILNEVAASLGRTLETITTGFADKGADIGSSAVGYITKPRVMLVSGEGTSANDMGEVWHYFEQQINYPLSLVRYQDLTRVKLSDYDVVILPDGRYNNFPLEKVQDWVEDGGKLIAMGNAITQFADKKGFSLKSKDDKKNEKDVKKPDLAPYDSRDRASIRNNIPGAIYKVYLDNTHPLGYGYPGFYYTLKLGDDVYDYLEDGNVNVGTLKKDSYLSGFAGDKAKAKLTSGLLFGVEHLGRGSIVYLTDDPLFRAFWENGKLLFANAVFMVN